MKYCEWSQPTMLGRPTWKRESPAVQGVGGGRHCGQQCWGFWMNRWGGRQEGILHASCSQTATPPWHWHIVHASRRHSLPF